MKRTSEQGTVLMEVLLALLLFVGAAAVIGGGLSASIRALDRVRLNGHAVDLAVTVMSELQMGAKPVKSSGPEAFPPPFEVWTWETIVSESELEDASARVEVVIRHEEENYVLRLAQLLPAAEGSENEEVGEESDLGEETGETEAGEEMLDLF